MRVAISAKAVLFLQIILSSWTKTPTVRLSIPEGHYIILLCPGHTPEDSALLEWRDGGGQVVATKLGHSAHSNNKDKYSLLTDGSLFVKNLQSGDSGEFRCGDQVAADVEVLTGEDYVVSAGRTVHLPCKVSDKQTHKWTFRKNKSSERQIIFVKFANGTLRKETEDPKNRFKRTSQNSLHISDLQPSDAGQYWCNGKKAAVLAVRTEIPNDTNQTEFTTEETDTVPMAVLISLCALVLLAVVLIFLLINRKRYRKVRLSIPEGHYIILVCPGHTPADSTPLEWRDGGGQVVATMLGHSAHSNNKDKYSLLMDGSLFVRNLQSGDSGEFRCGDLVAADVEVLTGEDYVISAGRTVHLPCKVSDKQTHKWTFRKNKSLEHQIIFVKFANGTLRKETEDPQNRFMRMSDNSLHISDLQPSDAGQYWCNGKKAAVLAVRTEIPNDTNQTEFTTEETDTGTDISENGDPDHDNVLMAVLISLCALILLAVVLIFLLINRKRYRKGLQNQSEIIYCLVQKP